MRQIKEQRGLMICGGGGMKELTTAACCLMAAVAAARADDAPVAPAQPPWTYTFASEARYFSWTSTRGYPPGVAGTGGGSGAELYIPYAAQLAGNPNEDWKLELLGRGGWVWADQYTPGLSGKVQTPTDTTLSATLTFIQLNGIQPFGSLNFNLPTGESALFGTAANARMDPDLVDISTFGEGFNVGETFGVNLPINKEWMITTSIGYIWRGSYLRENGLDTTILTPPTVQSPTNIEPGVLLTYYAAIGYQSGPWAVTVNGSIIHEGQTSEDDVPLYKPGLRYLFTENGAYTWRNGSTTSLNLSESLSNRNEVTMFGTVNLVEEQMNTNSDLYRIGFQHLIPVGNYFAYGPIGSFLYRDRNGYDPGTLQFVPGKERWSAGVIARYAVNNAITLNARAEFVWTHEDDMPAPGNRYFDALQDAFVPGSAVPQLSSTGLQTALGANIKF